MCLFDCKCKSLKRLGENIKQNRKKQTTKEKLEGEHKQNINTGFPAREPLRKMNISKGLAGRFLFFFFFFFFLCFPLIYIYIYIHIYFLFFLFKDNMLLYVFFDCKCKSLKRLGENINNKHKETYKQTEQLEGKQKKTTETNDFQPTNLRE